jgi:ABC-type uncharacterized transport system permease subunit
MTVYLFDKLTSCSVAWALVNQSRLGHIRLRLNLELMAYIFKNFGRKHTQDSAQTLQILDIYVLSIRQYHVNQRLELCFELLAFKVVNFKVIFAPDSQATEAAELMVQI